MHIDLDVYHNVSDSERECVYSSSAFIKEGYVIKMISQKYKYEGTGDKFCVHSIQILCCVTALLLSCTQLRDVLCKMSAVTRVSTRRRRMMTVWTTSLMTVTMDMTVKIRILRRLFAISLATIAGSERSLDFDIYNF